LTGAGRWPPSPRDDRAPVFYAIIQTCRLYGVDPEARLADVIGRIAASPLRRVACPPGAKA
jgi:hypothetical protein